MRTKVNMDLSESQALEFASHDMSIIDLLVRDGARRMLEHALHAEVEEYITRHSNVVDEEGKRMVVRNGHSKKRSIFTGAGPLEIAAPRIDDRRTGEKFTSAILPPYMRKTPTLDKLIPCLYLKGISTGQFGEAIEVITGSDARGFSPASINGMMKAWEAEYREWNERDLSDAKYVYIWADGVYLNVRLGDRDKVCLLVILGTTHDGRKELVGLASGYRESKESWQDLLRNLKKRGLSTPPELAIADGALGFWGAIEEEFSQTKHQRCWVHKTANILDKMPKRTQERAKPMIHNIYLAETKQDALNAYDEFMNEFDVKYPKACNCLSESKEELFAFFDFPAEHWVHIRTSNPIESAFATVKHRSKRTKGHGSRSMARAMAWKLCLEAEKHWRRIKGYKMIEKIISGVKFKDGLEVKVA